MKLTYKILAVAVAISLCMVMTLPASAITITGYTDINIADYVSGKEYDGEEVIVSYNMPLHPYAEYYGTAADGTHGIFATSTDIYFTQDAVTDTSSYFTAIINFGYFTKGSGTYTLGTGYAVDPNICTHVLLYGVLYPLILTASTPSVYFWDIGDTDCDLQYTVSGDRWSFSGPAGSYTLSVGVYQDVTEQIYEYSHFGASLYPLGFSDGNVGVVDVSDIREGANFDLRFSYKCNIITSGTPSDPTPSFSAYFLDENGNQIHVLNDYLQVRLDTDRDTTYDHNVTFTVPAGAAYFYILFDTSLMDVQTCRKIDWSFYDLVMSCSLSALEEEAKLLDEINNKLDHIYNGDPNDQNFADDFMNDVGGKADKLDGLNDKIQDMHKPQLGAGDISVNDYVNPNQMLTTMPFLTVLFENEMPITMIMLVLTVGLCAYALFGKRG